MSEQEEVGKAEQVGDVEWEPTEEDREEYGRALDDYYCGCREQGCGSSSSDLNWIRPLWKRLQNAGLPLAAYEAKDFWVGLREQEAWTSAKLLRVTEGMPQPARRRMTLEKLSPAQHRALQEIDPVRERRAAYPGLDFGEVEGKA